MTLDFLSGEHIVLVGALLLFVAVMAGKVAYRFGAPALLLFLGVGMLFGWDFISFNSPELTQFIGMIALCIILFSGGMDTKFSDIRSILAPGVVLATVGVVLTALILAGFVRLVAPWMGFAITFPMAMLLASTMASTDSASVFSILRSKKQGLKEDLRPLLELESGSNDPMAYMLTLLMIGIIAQSDNAGVGANIFSMVIQFVVGGAAGYGVGRAAVWAINRINLQNKSLYSVLLLAFIFFSFSITDLLHGNGYLAVYVSGLVVGNHRLTEKRTLNIFFDGFTWLMQIVMFLMLGLLVNTRELIRPDVLGLGCMVGLFMMFVARPVAVFLTLLPFRRFSLRARTYISWVGLRGAVPILFATYPLIEGTPHADLLFNVVFLSTILSLLLQGTSVSQMANWLGLAYTEKEASFRLAMHEDITSALSEVEVNEAMLSSGRTLKEISLPENTLVMMVLRDGSYFVPQGKDELRLGDKLLFISDRSEELEEAYRELGIDEVMKHDR